MKKMFLKLLFITIIMVFTIINFYRINVNQKTNNSVVLENIKAIADSEGGGGGGIPRHVACEPANSGCFTCDFKFWYGWRGLGQYC